MGDDNGNGICFWAGLIVGLILFGFMAWCAHHVTITF